MCALKLLRGISAGAIAPAYAVEHASVSQWIMFAADAWAVGYYLVKLVLNQLKLYL